MIVIDGKEVSIDRYPDGTPKMSIDHCGSDIYWYYDNDSELFELYLVTMHMRELGATSLNLHMPYLPNARMDRVKSSSEVFTLKHFCKFINSLEFNSVAVLDAHSNVSAALLNNFVDTYYKLSKNINELLIDLETDILFYPDEGSTKRYTGFYRYPYAYGIKKRDWKTGEISKLDIIANNNDFKGRTVTIIDDICSYGGTFLRSSKLLKELGADKIYLVVSHCEDSICKGDFIKSGLVDGIYTTKSLARPCTDSSYKALVRIIPGTYSNLIRFVKWQPL